jgi:hypothetical protein
MSGFFMIRPPEETRVRRKPGEEEPMPPLYVLQAFIRQSWTSLWGGAKNVIKKQVDIRTTPLEQRMKDARTGTLSEEEIEILLKDPNPLVRMELVHNDTISGDILERLKHDPDVTVSTIARRKQLQFM